MEDILYVEDAGGNSLKYSGVVSLDLKLFPDVPVTVETPFLLSCMETRYNHLTPLVVETYVIDYLTTEHSDIKGLCVYPTDYASRASMDKVSALGLDGNVVYFVLTNKFNSCKLFNGWWRSVSVISLCLNVLSR